MLNSKRFAAGFFAGAVGGLIGSAAKAAAEAIYPPRTQGQIPPPIVLIRKIAGHRLPRQTEQRAMTATHFAFGAVTGGFYGMLAESAPEVTGGRGLYFGIVLDLLTHESALPLLGLSDAPLKQTAREQSSEAITHVVYGVSTELIRRLIR